MKRIITLVAAVIMVASAWASELPKQEYWLMDVNWTYLNIFYYNTGAETSVTYIATRDGNNEIKLGSGVNTSKSNDFLMSANAKTVKDISDNNVEVKTSATKQKIYKVTLNYAAGTLTTEEATELPLSVGEVQVATFVAPANVTIPANVKAYTLAYDTDHLVATEITTGTIPANTPVLINAPKGDYSFAIVGGTTVVNEATRTVAGNSRKFIPDAQADALYGVFQMHYVPTNSYVLSNGSKGVGFYKVTATNVMIPPFRAYVTVPAAVEARSLSIVFDGGGTTGIADVNGKKEDVRSDIFNLSGQRVGNDFRGIVVKNGRKYIQK